MPSWMGLRERARHAGCLYAACYRKDFGKLVAADTPALQALSLSLCLAACYGPRCLAFLSSLPFSCHSDKSLAYFSCTALMACHRHLALAHLHSHEHHQGNASEPVAILVFCSMNVI
jgi:hypothetical protein